MKRLWYVALDIVVVVIFVIIGLHAHGHRESLGNLVSVSAPFLLGVVLGWVAVRLQTSSLSLLRSGAMIWVITVAVGQVVRLLDGQGSALGFLLVTVGFLGACMLGWRVIVLGIERATSSPSQIRQGR
jgi:predicted neutral ceramidase superfamily lipid hydrolase